MGYLDRVSLTARNYKCFGENEEGIDSIRPINLIIGRNNSGKSALLDLIGYATHTDTIVSINKFGYKNQTPEIFITKPLTENEIRTTFRDNANGGQIPGNHLAYGSAWIDKPIKIKLLADDHKQFVSINPGFNNDAIRTSFGSRLGEEVINPFVGRTFKRLYADRDIRPEANRPLNLSPNGDGATNLIQLFLNQASLGKRDIVEKQFLPALNSIFAPDIKFERILPQFLDDGKWEIYLEEEKKGSIPLSNSGSGLKTIILVLCYLILVPSLENKTDLGHYIFAFEELENNLHPGLLRKLFQYIDKQITESGSYAFVTTHSNVVIDLFNKSSNAQLLHVAHNGEASNVKRVETLIESGGILDDLDVRASDLLQSNSIVWVEGPSDRVYLNKWIDIWSDSQLKEGVHYQCVFYGGKLLSHLQADPASLERGLKMFNVNRHSILLIDSDKSPSKMDINDTKKRMKQEVENSHGFVWITQGKEIENYIPSPIFERLYTLENLRKLNMLGEISNYLDRISSGEGKKFLKNKVLFAEKASKLFTKEDIEQSPTDLKIKVKEVCDKIKSWNKIEILLTE